MSYFNSIAKQVKELDDLITQRKQDEATIGSYLSGGVQCIEVDDVATFGDKVAEYLSPSYIALDDYLKTQQGRPVIRWNIKGFRKNDAIGSLCSLSKMPLSPKPVIIIENITEIPVGDDSIYDDPKLVENLMLHNWKNESSVFDVPNYGHFELRPADYSVLITWSSATTEKMMKIWCPSDGLHGVVNKTKLYRACTSSKDNPVYLHTRSGDRLSVGKARATSARPQASPCSMPLA